MNEIIGHSKAIKGIFVAMKQAIETDVDILITGETGTGKVTAKGIHDNSPRRNQAPVTRDCGTFSNYTKPESSILHKVGYITAYLCTIFTICITMIACPMIACPPEQYPSAETPTYLNSGIGNPPRGKLNQSSWNPLNFHVDSVIPSPGAGWTMSFYITIRCRLWTTLKASYDTAAITLVDTPDTQPFIELAEGPRPYSVNLINAVANGENIMWVHEEQALGYNLDSYVDYTLAIVIGVGNPTDLRTLEFWTESINPQYSGTEAVSEHLVLVLTSDEPVTFEPSTYRVFPNRYFTVHWNVPRAARLWIYGSNLSEVEVSHPSGSMQIRAPNTNWSTIYYWLKVKVIGTEGIWNERIRIERRR